MRYLAVCFCPVVVIIIVSCCCCVHTYVCLRTYVVLSKSKYHEIVFPTSFPFWLAAWLFPCVYKRDMNNIRRFWPIISNNILLLIAFWPSSDRAPYSYQYPSIPPFRTNPNLTSQTIWLLQTHILCCCCSPCCCCYCCCCGT